MSEFGHSAYRGGGFHVDQWGAGPFVITVDGKSWRFEDSDRFGPMLVRRNGAPRSNPYPSDRSPFWWAYRLWREQGRRVADDGETCVMDYKPKRPTKFRWVTGRDGRYRDVVELGDDGGGLMEIVE